MITGIFPVFGKIIPVKPTGDYAIQKVINSSDAGAGQTILINDGTYFECLTKSKPLTILTKTPGH